MPWIIEITPRHLFCQRARIINALRDATSLPLASKHRTQLGPQIFANRANLLTVERFFFNHRLHQRLQVAKRLQQRFHIAKRHRPVSIRHQTTNSGALEIR